MPVGDDVGVMWGVGVAEVVGVDVLPGEDVDRRDADDLSVLAHRHPRRDRANGDLVAGRHVLQDPHRCIPGVHFAAGIEPPHGDRDVVARIKQDPRICGRGDRVHERRGVSVVRR